MVSIRAIDNASACSRIQFDYTPTVTDDLHRVAVSLDLGIIPVPIFMFVVVETPLSITNIEEQLGVKRLTSESLDEPNPLALG